MLLYSESEKSFFRSGRWGLEIASIFSSKISLITIEASQEKITASEMTKNPSTLKKVKEMFAFEKINPDPRPIANKPKWYKT